MYRIHLNKICRKDINLGHPNDNLNFSGFTALMDVPSDFLLYGSGVYQRTNLASHDHSGFHSVKVIGWGEEAAAGTPFWLCMNSWGREWGEDGLFRIVRGRNEVQGRRGNSVFLS